MYVCAGYTFSRKGIYGEMASISRTIPFFCLEIPDAITNEILLQKDDNLGLRGCITLTPGSVRAISFYLNLL